MRKVFLSALALTSGLTVVGCNNGGSSDIQFDELTARIGTAYCGYAQRCGATSALEQYILHSTITNCAQQTGTYFANTQFARYQEAIDAGTIHYDAASAGRCLAAFDTLGCGPAAASGQPDACIAIFTGTVADGAACSLDEECSRTSHCAGASGVTCGMCTHTPQIGEACPTSDCATGAYCASGTCAALLAAGAACTASDNSCQTGLTCTSGTCMTATRAQAGQPCGAGCDTGLVCAFTGTGTMCRAPRTDGSCQGLLTGSDCASGTTCSASLGMNGTCGAYPTLGQACSGACAAPARCVNMMCHASGELGVTCSGNDDCISGVCDATGVCAPQPLCTP